MSSNDQHYQAEIESMRAKNNALTLLISDFIDLLPARDDLARKAREFRMHCPDPQGILGELRDQVDRMRRQRGDYVVAAPLASPVNKAYLMRLETALREIAEPHDCGCRPCMGSCYIRDEVEGLKDIARAALQSKRCDKQIRGCKDLFCVLEPGHGGDCEDDIPF